MQNNLAQKCLFPLKPNIPFKCSLPHFSCFGFLLYGLRFYYTKLCKPVIIVFYCAKWWGFYLFGWCCCQSYFPLQFKDKSLPWQVSSGLLTAIEIILWECFLKSNDCLGDVSKNTKIWWYGWLNPISIVLWLTLAWNRMTTIN